jgi:outer membrane protein
MSVTKSCFALLAAFVGLSTLTYGQQSTAYDLQQCVDLALKNNLSVKQSELNVLRSRNNLNQSKFNLLPNISGSASLNYNFGRSIDPFTNQFTTDPVRNSSLSISAGVNVFSGFQAQNQIRQNKAQNMAAVYDYQKAKNDIILNVVTAYTTVVFNMETIKNARLQLNTTTEQAIRTEKLVQAGSLPVAGLYDLKAQQASDELALVNAENTYDLSLLALKQLLNLPASDPFELMIPTLEAPADSVYPVSAEAIYATALGHMPEIKSAERSVYGAKIGIRVAQGAYMPSLSAFASSNTFYSSIGGENSFSVVGFTNPTPVGFTGGGDTVFSFPQPIVTRRFQEKSFADQLEFNRRENIGFSLTIPIFNRFQSRTNVSNARIALKSAEYAQQETRNQLRQVIERAYNDVSAAAKRYSGAQKQIKAREEAFRAAEQRFQFGAIHSVDYLVAQNNLNRARSEELQARFDYLFKTKILDFYLQKPLEF